MLSCPLRHTLRSPEKELVKRCFVNKESIIHCPVARFFGNLARIYSVIWRDFVRQFGKNGQCRAFADSDSGVTLFPDNQPFAGTTAGCIGNSSDMYCRRRRSSARPLAEM